LLSRERQGDTRVTFRIYRSSTPDAIVFALSGDIDREHAARLQKFLTSATDRRVTLDLQNVTLIDRAAVQFLAGVEATGIRIVNCPGYVRTWIAAERDSQPQPTPEPDNQERPTVIRRGDGTHLHGLADIPQCQRPAARLSLERTTTTEAGDNT